MSLLARLKLLLSYRGSLCYAGSAHATHAPICTSTQCRFGMLGSAATAFTPPKEPILKQDIQRTKLMLLAAMSDAEHMQRHTDHMYSHMRGAALYMPRYPHSGSRRWPNMRLDWTRVPRCLKAILHKVTKPTNSHTSTEAPETK